MVRRILFPAYSPTIQIGLLHPADKLAESASVALWPVWPWQVSKVDQIQQRHSHPSQNCDGTYGDLKHCILGFGVKPLFDS